MKLPFIDQHKANPMALEVIRILAHPPAAVWEVVGDVGRVDWVPGVAHCEIDSDIRRFTMRGAGGLAERILRRDPDAMLLEYSVIESTPPLSSHLASIQLQPDGAGTRFIWRTAVEPSQVEPFIAKAMNGSLDLLEQVLSTTGSRP
ncbi:MAG: SRPBCC family protein [Pseudomonadales bacterium]